MCEHKSQGPGRHTERVAGVNWSRERQNFVVKWIQTFFTGYKRETRCTREKWEREWPQLLPGPRSRK